jgi:hypothetical protein
MSTLNEERVIEIAKSVAAENNVSFASIQTAPALDSSGSEAIEIKIVLTPGSANSIMGERSARTIVEVIRKLADAGEGRFPIVRYEEQGASAGS